MSATDVWTSGVAPSILPACTDAQCDTKDIIYAADGSDLLFADSAFTSVKVQVAGGRCMALNSATAEAVGTFCGQELEVMCMKDCSPSKP